MLPCLSSGREGGNPVVSRLSEESFGAGAADCVLGWSTIGLLRTEAGPGMWRTEGRRGRSSLRRVELLIESLFARDGLLEPNRLEREISAWLSDGDGVGDLEVVEAGADRAAVEVGEVSIATLYEVLTPNVRGDG